MVIGITISKPPTSHHQESHFYYKLTLKRILLIRLRPIVNSIKADRFIFTNKYLASKLIHFINERLRFPLHSKLSQHCN